MTSLVDKFACQLAIAIDKMRYRFWLQFQNGNAQLLAAYEAVDDARDCIESVRNAVTDGDYDEAVKLATMAIDRLEEHVLTLKGLL